MPMIPEDHMRELRAERQRKLKAIEDAAQTPRPLVVDETAIARRNEIAQNLLSYYEFLVSMYLPEEVLKRPPETGWDWINAERFAFLGKTDAVIDLYKHIPYISDNDEYLVDVRAMCMDYTGRDFNWKYYKSQNRNSLPPEYYETWNEKPEWLPLEEPQHIALLVRPTKVHGPYVMLDTRDGQIAYVVHRDSQDGVSVSTSETLKKLLDRNVEELCNLSGYVPISPTEMIFAGNSWVHEDIVDDVKALYRKHGWASAEYDKTACLSEIQDAWQNWVLWYDSQKQRK